MKAQKKPVIIDYYDGPLDNLQIQMWMHEFDEHFTKWFLATSEGDIKVKTLEGTSYDVTTDDVIIRGVNGEYYPCKKDIFEKTYDLI